MRMSKKIMLLLALKSLVSYSTQFSITNELKINDESRYRPDERVKNEWTIARGYYKFSDKLRFIFDIDRDFVEYENSDSDYTGWDTYGGLEYKFEDTELFGKKVENKGTLDFAWDNALTMEREAGFSLSSKINLADSTSFTVKGMFRNIHRRNSGSNYDANDNVGGIETWLSSQLNDDWRFSASVKGYWGGYYDGGSTFYSYEGREAKDGFNYEGYTLFAYEKELYKTDMLEIKFETDFAHYFYGYGDDYKGTSGRYTKSYVRPGIKFIQDLNDNVSVHLNTRYNILGQYAFDNGTTRDLDEIEVIVGINMRY